MIDFMDKYGILIEDMNSQKDYLFQLFEGRFVMKRCMLLVVVFCLLLSMTACAAVSGEGKKPEATAPGATEPDTSEPPVTDPVEKEEMVTISMLTKVSNTSYHKNWDNIIVSETVESILEYDDNYGLTNVKMYDEGMPVYEYVYGKDPDRLLVAQHIDSEGNKHPDQEYSYNENGDYLTVFDYSTLPGEDTKIYYSYDDSGKLQKEICHSYIYDWDGSYSSERIEETIYTYDAEGKILSEDTYKAGKKTRTICYTYDDSGKLLEVRDSSDYSWQIRTYDSYGNFVAVTNGYHNPSREAETTHYQNTYENGKLLERTGYENGVLRLYEKYDSAGNLILALGYFWMEVDGEPYRNEYEYDENGRLIRHFSSELGNDGQRYDYTFIYTYDENGWLTSKKTYYFDELSGEYIPSYKTVTVTKEQAESIERVNQKYYYLPDPNC